MHMREADSCKRECKFVVSHFFETNLSSYLQEPVPIRRGFKYLIIVIFTMSSFVDITS
jgi:hypothetical protein